MTIRVIRGFSLILCSCHTDFTDFTDFICKAPVLTIRVISVIRVFFTYPPFCPTDFTDFTDFVCMAPVLTIASFELTTSPLPLERGWG